MVTMSSSIELKVAEDVPACIRTYTPEENSLLLRIGSDAVESLKKHLVSIEAGETWTEQSKMLNSDTLDMAKKMMQTIMNEQLAARTQEWKDRIADKDAEIQRVLATLKEKNDEIIEQKHKNDLFSRSMQQDFKRLYEAENGVKLEQMSILVDKMETMTSVKTRTDVVNTGNIGESKFREIAVESFKFFEEFDILDMANKTSKGDFHLLFKEFNVLVDVKNGGTTIENPVIEKMRRDLLANDMMFGWLVSMNTNIRKFDKFPITVEWLRNDKCLIYVNSLMLHDSPVEFLRLVWNFCNMISLLFKQNTTTNQDMKLIYDNIKKMEAIMKEENTIINDMIKNGQKLKEMNNTNKEMIRDNLNDKSTELMNTTNMCVKKPTGGRKPRAAATKT